MREVVLSNIALFKVLQSELNLDINSYSILSGTNEGLFKSLDGFCLFVDICIDI